MRMLLIRSRSNLSVARTAVSKVYFSVSVLDDVQYHRKAKDVINEYARYPNRASNLILSRDIKHENVKLITRDPNYRSQIYCIDNFVSESDCRVATEMLMQSELQSFIMSPGERTVSADTFLLEDIINTRTAALIDHFKSKMHRFAETSLNRKLKEAGTLLSWLSPPSSTHKNEDTSKLISNIVSDSSSYNYWHAHCDKANNKEYDVSVLLYLNNDYTGGSLIFMDREGKDSEIQPTSGRLLIFHSCVDNIHRIEPVVTGNRFLLSAWYSFA